MVAKTFDEFQLSDYDGWQRCNACDVPIDCTDSEALVTYESSNLCGECYSFERDIEETERSLRPGRV